jgi:hypothetical protein
MLAGREDFHESSRSASEASGGRGGTERPLAAEGRARKRNLETKALLAAENTQLFGDSADLRGVQQEGGKVWGLLGPAFL